MISLKTLAWAALARRIGVALLIPAPMAPFLWAPLDRDEGEYAYAADLWLSGGLPYRDSLLQKPPAVVITYAAVFRTLGTYTTGIHSTFLRIILVIGVVLGTLAERAHGFAGWLRPQRDTLHLVVHQRQW